MATQDLTCGECGHEMKISTGPGRSRNYRGESGYAIPADLTYPVCPHCGAQWLSDSQIDQLSAALELQRKFRRLVPQYVNALAFTTAENPGLKLERAKLNVGQVNRTSRVFIQWAQGARASSGVFSMPTTRTTAVASRYAPVRLARAV